MISIVVPIYNASKYLKRCITCVQNQMYHDWELILIDDGSTDDSATICREFAAEDKRITLIEQKNAGPSSARNRGLELAKGEYVCFVDADDWFDEQMLQDYANAVREKKWDIVFQGFIIEKENGIVNRLSLAMDNDSQRGSKENIICKLYKDHSYGWSWCKMFSRDVIENNGIRFDDSLTLWEDELFTTHFLQRAHSVKTLKCRHYHYVQHEHSLMNTGNTYIRRLALSEIMNEALISVANNELKLYLNKTYNRNLKYSLLMALKNAPDHKCDDETKRRLLAKYYARCKEYPSLLWYNVLGNRISYLIAEFVLLTHNDRFITLFFSRI